jgi:hypothetical protein
MLGVARVLFAPPRCRAGNAWFGRPESLPRRPNLAGLAVRIGKTERSYDERGTSAALLTILLSSVTLSICLRWKNIYMQHLR